MKKSNQQQSKKKRKKKVKLDPQSDAYWARLPRKKNWKKGMSLYPQHHKKPPKPKPLVLDEPEKNSPAYKFFREAEELVKKQYPQYEEYTTNYVRLVNAIYHCSVEHLPADDRKTAKRVFVSSQKAMLNFCNPNFTKGFKKSNPLEVETADSQEKNRQHHKLDEHGHVCS